MPTLMHGIWYHGIPNIMPTLIHVSYPASVYITLITLSPTLTLTLMMNTDDVLCVLSLFVNALWVACGNTHGHMTIYGYDPWC